MPADFDKLTVMDHYSVSSSSAQSIRTSNVTLSVWVLRGDTSSTGWLVPVAVYSSFISSTRQRKCLGLAEAFSFSWDDFSDVFYSHTVHLESLHCAWHFPHFMLKPHLKSIFPQNATPHGPQWQCNEQIMNVKHSLHHKAQDLAPVRPDSADHPQDVSAA